MKYLLLSLLSAAGASALPSAGGNNVITVTAEPPKDAYRPLERFVSYSIEFSSLLDFAGNLSAPNRYSNQLLDNIARYAGGKPYIRVGGNTQDVTLFNKSQDVAVIQNFSPLNPDYPLNQTIGPKWFESYQTFPDTLISHGFNLAEIRDAEFQKGLLDSVPFACKALRGRLLAFELGNEPDFYYRNLSTPVAPRGNYSVYNETNYVAEWLEWTRKIRAEMQKSCPGLASKDNFRFLAPSFASSNAFAGNQELNLNKTFAAGLNTDNNLKYIALHNYLGARGQPGITLQGTLMNHTNNIASVSRLRRLSDPIRALPAPFSAPNAPAILGEGNSLARQGIGGVTNAFGAALWGFDFALQLASQGIGRWHMHQGTNYRYQAWQPIATRNTTIGTKAPYYGNIAVASFLGSSRPRIVDLNLPTSTLSAYAAYDNARLSKLAVINLQTYNASADNAFRTAYPRPTKEVTFRLPAYCSSRKIKLRRLSASGSDAISGVTFDGWSYAWELQKGKPVRLGNVTVGETLSVGRDGTVRVGLVDSSAVILEL